MVGSAVNLMKRIILSLKKPQNGATMKIRSVFVIILLFTNLVVYNSEAGTLTLSWDLYKTDANQKAQLTADPNYIVIRTYSKTGSSAYDYSNPNQSVSANLNQVKVSGLQTGNRVCFVIRAFIASNPAGSQESPDSNEACGTVPKLKPPSGFKLIDFHSELELKTDNQTLIHFLGYYMNSETSEIITLETTQKFSEL